MANRAVKRLAARPVARMAARPLARMAAGLAAALALAGAACVAQAAQPCSKDDLGCAIFAGEREVHAHLRGDSAPLPSATTRCVNCHAQSDPKGAFAPPLTAAYLLDAQSRRGGPPSRYDPSTFCRAVRTGIDPAYVLLRKSMPDFQISDAECNALWRYVANR